MESSGKLCGVPEVKSLNHTKVCQHCPSVVGRGSIRGKCGRGRELLCV